MSKPLDEATAHLEAGGVVMLVDQGRDCGDLVACGETITEDQVNLMVRHGRGIVAVAITAAQRDRLRIERMPGTEAPATVEAGEGVSTGISARDRARTIRVLSDRDSEPDDLVSPGHVLPIVASGPEGRRSERAASLLKLVERAGSSAAAACAVLDEDGRQASADRARKLAAELSLPWVEASAAGTSQA